MNFWSQPPFSLWIAHLAPESETRFDFQKYISRTLEEDFVVVVGITLVFQPLNSSAYIYIYIFIYVRITPELCFICIFSPLIWFVAILILLSNTYGIYSYLWLPFLPLIVRTTQCTNNRDYAY
ncbi:MLO-like protein isoform X1 [Humulus lupulus]|uniref:MLO-like protein isoform X1 n=1 Tax=Humulus lupulus TaxID=3486 RepID=UPI002B410494|nr:MLO-like protein isoform X1 [Humulus lupulus]